MLVFTAVLVFLIPIRGHTVSNESLEKDLTRKNRQLDDELSEIRTIVKHLQIKLNNASDLEARVKVLEDSVADLEGNVAALSDEVDDVESTNLLQDDRLNIIDKEINDNIDDIEELVDITTGLDERVEDLELGGNEPWVACLSAPCNNDATCIDVNVDTFICACKEGYFGLTCSESFVDAAFLASLVSSVSGSSNPIVFTNAVINPGGHYSTSTGKYTAPYDGIYQFSVHLQYSGNTMIKMYVDGSQTGEHNDYYSYSDVYYRSTTLLLDLRAGQTVHVGTGSSYGGAYGSSSYLYSYFSGHLINS